MSKEHVWPEWMRGLLPPDVLAADHTYIYEDSARGEFRRVERQPIFNMVVKSVCEPCNNGWMSRVEGAVRPFVEGMLQGRGRVLHAGGQAAIANWGLLKSLVFQLSFRDDPTIPASHYRELYELRDTGQLPETVTVSTAKAAWSHGQAKPGFFRLNGIARKGRENRPDVDGYLLTFTSLDLVVQVIRIYGDERAEFIHRPRLAETVRCIWPPGESFTWPPGPALTHAGIVALGGGEGILGD